MNEALTNILEDGGCSFALGCMAVVVVNVRIVRTYQTILAMTHYCDHFLQLEGMKLEF